MSEWLDGFSMAWGMFLAIPCPLRRWNEKAREKMLVCLPLVGLAVGGIWLGLYLLLRHAAIGGLYAFLMAALPWLVTGFMHLDGYMDVCDAVLSRRELATRQRILKDSHCGAFAVIGMVLFSTYSMVMDNGKTVRNRVLERESERVFWGILDNDIAGLCLIDDKRSTLPPLSREPIVPSDAFYRLTETDKPQPSDDEVLLSFATISHLADMPGTPLPGPVCVEYVLRNGNRSAAFIRRERAYCGVEGDFPWSELVLVRNVKSLEVALYSTKTQFVEDWPSPLPPGAVPEAIRFTLHREEEEQPELFVVPVFPRRSHVRN